MRNFLNSQRNRKAYFEPLEPRKLLSASPAPEGADVAIVEDMPPNIAVCAEKPLSEIVFVDQSVQGYEGLIENPERNVEVILIGTEENGFEKVSNILNDREDIDSIHILSHGKSGEIFLGNAILNSDNLDSYRAHLSSWSSSLSADADILIYGCDVGKVYDFIDNISSITGADVAASDDLTGDADAGGDAVLEIQSGQVESQEVIAEAAFAEGEVLTPVSIDNFEFTRYDWNMAGDHTLPLANGDDTTLDTALADFLAKVGAVQESGLIDKINEPSTRDGERFAYHFSGYFTANESGTYTFSTRSDDGSILFVDQKLLVNNNGDHAAQTVQGTINLIKGQTYEINAFFYEWGGGDVLETAVKGPSDGSFRDILNNLVFTENGSAIETEGVLKVQDIDAANTVAASVALQDGGGYTGGEDLSTMLTASSTNIIGAGETEGDLNWTFDSGSETFDYLNDGESLTIVYRITVTDGGVPVTKDISITINGVTSISEVSGNLTGEVTEADIGDVSSATGSISISNPDAGVPPTFNDANLTGNYGALSLVSGDWTYTLDQEKVQYLKVDESVTETITVEASDGSKHDIEISVIGANDSPVLSGFEFTRYTWNHGGDHTLPLPSGAATTMTESVNAFLGLVGAEQDSGFLEVIKDPSSDDGSRFAYHYKGHYLAQEAGTYSFRTESDDGSVLFVGEQLVVDNNGDHGRRTVSGDIDLVAGQAYEINVLFYEWGGGDVLYTGVKAPGDAGFEEITSHIVDLSESFVEADTALTASGSFNVEDIDLKDEVTATVRVVDKGGYTGSEDLASMVTISPSTVINSSGTSGVVNWSFNSGADAFNPIAQGESVTIEYEMVLSDGTGEATRKLLVTIDGTNDTLVATVISSTVTDSDPIFTRDLTDGISDPENGGITVSNVRLASIDGASSVDFSVSGSEVSVDPRQFINLSSGSITLTFSYDAIDDSGDALTNQVSNTYILTILLENEQPVATANGYKTDEQTLLTSGNLLTDGVPDSDIDTGQELSVSSVYYLDSQGSEVFGTIGEAFLLVSGATLTLNSDGSFTYDPTTSSEIESMAEDEFLESFFYIVDDGSSENNSESSAANVIITVTVVNNPPILQGPDTISLEEDSTVSINSIVVNDVDSEILEFSLSVTNGLLAFSDLNGLTVIEGANGSSDVTVQGSRVALNNALGGLSYSSNTDFNGIDSLELILSDLGNPGHGEALTASKSIGIDVTAVADTPQLQADNVSGLEAEEILLNISAEAGNDSEILSVVISDLPLEAILSSGEKVGSNWFLTEADLQNLTLLVPSAADFSIKVSALSIDGSSVSSVSQIIQVSIESSFVIPEPENQDSTFELDIVGVDVIPVSDGLIFSGNSLDFLQGGSQLQFEESFLSEDALSVISGLFNFNLSIDTEVAEAGIFDQSVKTLNVYDLSPLTESEQSFILDLIQNVEQDKLEDSVEDKEEDGFLFSVDDAALKEVSMKNIMEDTITQDYLDTRTSLDDTLQGDFDCFAV